MIRTNSVQRFLPERAVIMRRDGAHPAALAHSESGRLLLLDPQSGLEYAFPQLLYINGMRADYEGSVGHAAALRAAANEDVLLIYNRKNRLQHAIRAWLGIPDHYTRTLALLLDQAIGDCAPLIVSAQSLGTLKALNAARLVLTQRRDHYRLHAASGAALQRALAELHRIVLIFTGNVTDHLPPFIRGFVVYNIGDPVTGLFGTRRGSRTMPLIPIANDPPGSGGPHRYLNQVGAVACLIRIIRSRSIDQH